MFNKKATQLVIPFFFIVVSGCTEYKAKYPAELRQLHQNVWDQILDVDLDEKNLDLLLETVTENGEWPGIDYPSKTRGAWSPRTHLGNVSVWHTSRRERAGEIGYWVRSTITGDGIGSEAAARVVQVAFEELELHRVTLRIATGNLASERIAEKLGFVREGLLRKEVLVAGTWLDHSLWAILDEEYAAGRSRYAAEGWLGDRR